MQSNMGLAQTLSSYEILIGWEYVNSYPGRIARVTKEDIQRVARKYLVEDNRTVVRVVPADAAGK